MADPIQSPVPKLYTPIPSTPPSKPSAKASPPKPAAVDQGFVPSGPPLELPAASAGLPKGVTNPDPSTWPMPVLEREVLAMQAKRASDPKNFTESDTKKLLAMEAELSKRDASVPKLPEPSKPKTGVQLCKRTADIPVVEYMGLKHHWLKTGKQEAGMGPAGGGVPGHAEGNNGSYLGPTTWNDHTGESEGVGATCEDLPDVDEDCVDSVAIGTRTGRWSPGINDCHTVTQAVIDHCKKKPSPTQTTDEADAGVK